MSNLRSARLVGIGAIAGIALSLGLSALAERGNTGRNVLPLDELRQFSEVFGTIKAYYVEPVKDNKLITDAISGMLTGLDPHSAYLDENAFKELQVNTQGEFGGLGIEIGTEDGIIKVVSPIEDRRHPHQGHAAGRSRQDDARQAQEPHHPDAAAQGRARAHRAHHRARHHPGAVGAQQAAGTGRGLHPHLAVPGAHRQQPGQPPRTAGQAEWRHAQVRGAGPAQ